MYMVVENIAITCCPALALLGLLILLTNPLKAGDSSLLRNSLGWMWKQETGLPGQFPASTSVREKGSPAVSLRRENHIVALPRPR